MPEPFQLTGMHETMPIVTICLIVLTCITSAIGFNNPGFVEKFIFAPEYILRDRQGYRLVTCAFLHADWQHLLFNMFTLFAFGRQIELHLGITPLLAIYFASIIGGSLLSLFMHRHHVYRAYGASGGVCGVVYSCIFLFPGAGIYLMMIPFAIPAWAYAIGYILLTFYGIKKASDNIGHDAHLGGAIIGLLTATAFYPYIVAQSPWLYATVILLSVGICAYLFKNPVFLPSDSFTVSTPAPRRTATPRKPEPDINAILEKISRSGMKSLTEAEHRALREASQKSRRQSGIE